jgi:hypothetical protein
VRLLASDFGVDRSDQALRLDHQVATFRRTRQGQE